LLGDCAKPYFMFYTMTEQEAQIDALETLIAHCQVMAKARDPQRRIAASRLEIELSTRRSALLGVVPMAANFSRRDEDPTESGANGQG
jgi:hypothetical protein